MDARPIHVAVNGLDFHVLEAGTGLPLLLLHGFTGSAESWGPLLPALGRNRRVLAPDVIGHGASAAPAQPSRYEMDWAVRDLAAILDELNAPLVDLAGYSMGARLALYFAVHQPERVRRLVLESGSPGLASEHERRARIASDEQLAAMLERDGVEQFIDYWERIPLFASQRRLPAEIQAAHRGQRLRNRAQGLAGSLRGMGTGSQKPLWEKLSQLVCPVLLVAGELDTKYRDIAHRMDQLLPDGREAIVRDAGHTVHLEQPEAYSALITDFLGGDKAQTATEVGVTNASSQPGGGTGA